MADGDLMTAGGRRTTGEASRHKSGPVCCRQASFLWAKQRQGRAAQRHFEDERVRKNWQKEAGQRQVETSDGLHGTPTRG